MQLRLFVRIFTGRNVGQYPGAKIYLFHTSEHVVSTTDGRAKIRIQTLVALKPEKIRPGSGILSIFYVLYRGFGAALRMLDLENGEKERFRGFLLYHHLCCILVFHHVT